MWAASQCSPPITIIGYHSNLVGPLHTDHSQFKEAFKDLVKAVNRIQLGVSISPRHRYGQSDRRFPRMGHESADSFGTTIRTTVCSNWSLKVTIAVFIIYDR